MRKVILVFLFSFVSFIYAETSNNSTTAFMLITGNSFVTSNAPTIDDINILSTPGISTRDIEYVNSNNAMVAAIAQAVSEDKFYYITDISPSNFSDTNFKDYYRISITSFINRVGMQLTTNYYISSNSIFEITLNKERITYKVKTMSPNKLTFDIVGRTNIQ